MSSGAFAKELEVYHHHQSEWLNSYAGSFVAIQGERVDGFFKSYAEAFRSGLDCFGSEHDFLIKQVCHTEPVYFIS